MMFDAMLVALWMSFELFYLFYRYLWLQWGGLIMACLPKCIVEEYVVTGGAEMMMFVLWFVTPVTKPHNL